MSPEARSKGRSLERAGESEAAGVPRIASAWVGETSADWARLSGAGTCLSQAVGWRGIRVGRPRGRR